MGEESSIIIPYCWATYSNSFNNTVAVDELFDDIDDEDDEDEEEDDDDDEVNIDGNDAGIHEPPASVLEGDGG